ARGSARGWNQVECGSRSWQNDSRRQEFRASVTSCESRVMSHELVANRSKMRASNREFVPGAGIRQKARGPHVHAAAMGTHEVEFIAGGIPGRTHCGASHMAVARGANLCAAQFRSSG